MVAIFLIIELLKYIYYKKIYNFQKRIAIKISCCTFKYNIYNVNTNLLTKIFMHTYLYLATSKRLPITLIILTKFVKIIFNIR